MRRARSFRCLLVAAVALTAALVAVPAVAQDKARFELSGSRESLWVVRERRLGKTHDIIAKPIGQEWKWVARNIRGQIGGAVAMDRRLQVMFPNLSLLIYSLDTPEPIVGRSPDDPHWPAKGIPVALAGGNLADANSPDGFVALVLVPRTQITSRPGRSPGEDGDPNRPADPNAGEELGTLRRTVHEPLLFASDGMNWKRLASVPLRLTDKDTPIALCVSGGSVYVYFDRRGETPAPVSPRQNPIPAGSAGVLALQPGAAGSGNDSAPATTRPTGEQEDRSAGRWSVLVGDGQIPPGRLLGMVGLDNHVILALHSDAPAATTQPGELKRLTTTRAAGGDPRSILLVTCEPDRGSVSRQVVRKPGGNPLVLGDRLPLAAARLGDRVMLLWRDSDEPEAALRLGDSGPNGQLVAVKKLDIFTEPPAAAGSEEVIEYLMWAVLIAMVVPLFFFRPRGPQKPFALPPFVRPGNLLKRAAAGLIDLLPFTTTATLIVGIEQDMLDDPWSLARMETLPVEYAWAMVAALGLYVVYCMVMEVKFGATVGKMATGLRVVGNEAEPPDLRAIFLRNLVKIVELITFLMPLLFILPLITPFRQRLGDMLARTAVVEKASLDRHTPPPLEIPDQMRRDEDSTDRDDSEAQ
ncbi:MAG: RDD family protein [Phycisphaerae bacterium]